MLLLESKTRELLEISVTNEFNTGLQEFFREISNILREDNENVDLSGFQNRCNWFLSKIVDSKDVLLKYSETDNFKELFKDVVIGTGDQGQVTLTIGNNEVTGNSRYLAIVLLISAFTLYINLKSLGENFDNIGGALIEYFSQKLTLELGRRCDLSSYNLNGDVFRAIGNMIHGTSPVVNIFITTLGMLLITKDFTKSVQNICLLLATAIKSKVNNAIGFLYTYLEKAGQILQLDLEFLTKDIYYQFKVLIPL